MSPWAEHPVALSRTDGHSLWVNSLALQLASLTPAVADPEGGKIDRDETGAPTGILREGPAMQFVGRIIPRPTRQEIARAMQEGIAYAHRHGITAVHDMSSGDSFRDDLWAELEKVKDEGITVPVLSDAGAKVSGPNGWGTNKYQMQMMGDRNGHTFVLVGKNGRIRWRADYGGAPKYTMYVPDDHLLADLRQGMKSQA